jgi:hypothetical protein
MLGRTYVDAGSFLLIRVAVECRAAPKRIEPAFSSYRDPGTGCRLRLHPRAVARHLPRIIRCGLRLLLMWAGDVLRVDLRRSLEGVRDDVFASRAVGVARRLSRIVRCVLRVDLRRSLGRVRDDVFASITVG